MASYTKITNYGIQVGTIKTITPIWIQGRFPFGAIRVGYQTSRLYVEDGVIRFRPDEIPSSENPFDENFNQKYIEVAGALDQHDATRMVIEEMTQLNK